MSVGMERHQQVAALVFWPRPVVAWPGGPAAAGGLCVGP